MEWSEIFHELLDIIAKKHIAFYEDYFSFAGVCKSWHSSALEVATESHYLNGPPSRLPSLMLAEKKEEDGEFRELFLLSNESIRRIRLPEAYGKLSMSSCGWLATVGEDNDAKLLNPLSREIINLPNLNTFPEFLESSEWHLGISKLLFLNSLSLVVVLWGCSSRLGFCRIGDNKWTHVDKGWGGKIYDITFYNGRVYSFDCNSYIRVCDVYGEDPTVMSKVSRLTKDVYNDVDGDGAYIIGMDGDNGRRRLLVVIRKGMYDEDPLCDETYCQDRFKL